MPYCFNRLASAVALGLWLVSALPVHGQDPGTSREFRVSTALPAGTRTYSSGAWGLVEVGVANPSDEPAKVLSTLFFDDGEQQYGREISIPPRSRRVTWHPVLVPADIEPNGTNVTFRSLTFDRTGDEERLIPDPGGRMASDSLLPVETGGALTCWINSGINSQDTETHTTIMAARTALGLPPKVVSLRGHTLPPGAETLQGVELLILSGDRPLSDAAGLAAIRQWVARGGRLWVFLDQVSPPLVERLLGDACRLELVDRVGLTSVRVLGTGDAASDSDEEPRDYESPVDLVRTAADDVEVIQTVDGWPASFVQRVGRGEILFTTLGPRGWIRPATGRRRPGLSAAVPLVPGGSEAGDPLAGLAGRLWAPHARPPVLSEAWEPLLAEQVGYRIVGRGPVFSVLGIYCSVLCASAVWLARTGQLGRMAWVAPLGSVAAAAALAFLGWNTAGAVPATTAEGQFIETAPGSDDVRVSGLLFFYSPGGGESELGTRNGGIFMPDVSGTSSATRRLVWTDWDRWQWENVALPRGAVVAPFEKDLRLGSPVLARASFGPDGLSGRVFGPLEGPSDALIAGPSGAVATRFADDGTFSAKPADALAPGVFLEDSLLSDAQRRRQSFFRSLVSAGEFKGRTTLFAWVRRLDLGFDYPTDEEVTGDALASLPLVVERTPPGTEATIPSSFVRIRSVPPPDGGFPSPLFDGRSGEPADRTGDLESWMRFEFPAEVVPADLATIDFTVAIDGAVERLELLGWSGGQVKSLRSWSSPTNVSRVTVRGNDVLTSDDGSGFRLGLRVHGDATTVTGSAETGDALRQYWRVESIRVDATIRTRNASTSD